MSQTPPTEPRTRPAGRAFSVLLATIAPLVVWALLALLEGRVRASAPS